MQLPAVSSFAFGSLSSSSGLTCFARSSEFILPPWCWALHVRSEPTEAQPSHTGHARVHLGVQQQGGNPRPSDWTPPNRPACRAKVGAQPLALLRQAGVESYT